MQERLYSGAIKSHERLFYRLVFPTCFDGILIKGNNIFVFFWFLFVCLWLLLHVVLLNRFMKKTDAWFSLIKIPSWSLGTTNPWSRLFCEYFCAFLHLLWSFFLFASLHQTDGTSTTSCFKCPNLEFYIAMFFFLPTGSQLGFYKLCVYWKSRWDF